jgi:hypothetical protein
LYCMVFVCVFCLPLCLSACLPPPHPSPLLRRLLIPFTSLFVYLFQVGMLDKNSKVYASDHRAVFGRFRITHSPTAKEEKE